MITLLCELNTLCGIVCPRNVLKGRAHGLVTVKITIFLHIIVYSQPMYNHTVILGLGAGPHVLTIVAY